MHLWMLGCYQQIFSALKLWRAFGPSLRPYTALESSRELCRTMSTEVLFRRPPWPDTPPCKSSEVEPTVGNSLPVWYSINHTSTIFFFTASLRAICSIDSALRAARVIRIHDRVATAWWNRAVGSAPSSSSDGESSSGVSFSGFQCKRFSRPLISTKLGWLASSCSTFHVNSETKLKSID